jgi:hypothetical protein
MKILMGLAIVLMLTVSASATTTTVGPYSVSFDLRTATEPTVTSLVNTSADSSNYYISIKQNNVTVAGIGITDYSDWQDASTSLRLDMDLVNALKEAGEIQNPALTNRMIDGGKAIVGTYFDPQLNSSITVAGYWRDSKKVEGYGLLAGKSKVEILTKLPKDLADNLLNSLNIKSMNQPMTTSMPKVNPGSIRRFPQYDRNCMKNYEDIGYTPSMIIFMGYCIT